MATYQKPTEDLTSFNSSVFKTANESTLTLSEATSLFLARVGTASSEATSTTFTNDIYVNNVRAGVGNFLSTTNTCFGNGALAATTSTGLNNCGFGKDALAVISTGSANCCFGVNTLKASNIGQKNTCVGHVAGQAITGSSNDNVFIGNDCGTFVNGVSSSNTFVGSQSGRSTLGTASSVTALGFQTRCNFSGSTVIGIGSTATASNQITLGRASETVECVGTVSSISLKTARNLSINGKVFGIGAGGANTDSLFCGLTTGGGNGSNNSIYGSGSYANSGDGSSAKNTIIGALTMTSTATSFNDVTVVGYGCNNTGATAGTSEKITIIGSSASCANIESTAIGYGATATLANQIVLGRSTEFVECAGTDTTNGCLKLNGGLKLQTSYGAVPSSTMLGYRIALSAIAINPITSLTAVSIGSLALTVGVWSLNYTFELSAGTAVTATAQSFYFSNANGGAYATRIANTGTTRLHFQINYGNGDNPSYSGGGTYYASAAISLYPTLLINYTGTLTGTGYASATRIG